MVVTVPNARHALGIIAANRFGAAEALTLLAVTGTNGKTTTAYLVEEMLRAAGRGRACSAPSPTARPALPADAPRR